MRRAECSKRQGAVSGADEVFWMTIPVTCTSVSTRGRFARSPLVYWEVQVVFVQTLDFAVEFVPASITRAYSSHHRLHQFGLDCCFHTSSEADVSAVKAPTPSPFQTLYAPSFLEDSPSCAINRLAPPAPSSTMPYARIRSQRASLAARACRISSSQKTCP